MTNPSLQPGYFFQGLRVLKSSYEVREEAIPLPSALGVDLHMDESAGYAPGMVRYIQELKVHATRPGTHGPWLMRAEVTIEAIFSYPAGSKPNIPPQEFVTNAATVIVFPFAREWIHRLTSQAGGVSPILLPPLNLIALRGQKGLKEISAVPEAVASRGGDPVTFFGPPARKKSRQ